MEEDIQACNMQFLSVSAIIVLVFLLIIVGRKILLKAHGLIKAVLKLIMPQQGQVVVNLHREVGELRRATSQIAQDWRAMTALMTKVREQQGTFVKRLDSDFEAMGDCLQVSVKTSLEEEDRRNEERFQRINEMVADIKEDISHFRNAIEKKSELLSVKSSSSRVSDECTQTDLVMKRRLRDGHHHHHVITGKSAEEAIVESDSSRSAIVVIKKALTEFLKESKRHMSLERDAVMSDMKLMLAQLTDDREDIKNTIESAFSTATHQTQISFEQFGSVGRDAMKCIAVLSEKSEKAVANRFHESTEKLNEIFELLKGLNFDVSSIKQTLDNIDGQFDEIYQKLELGCQKNVEHSESVVNSLQSTARDWNEKTSNLEDICKQLGDTMRNIQNMVRDLDKGATMQLQQQLPQNSLQLRSDALSVDNIVALDQYTEPDGSISLPKVLQICYDKLTMLNEQIERGTGGIKQSVDVLLQKLRFLTDLVENSVDSLKNLNIQVQTENNLHYQNFNRELREFVGDILSLDSRSETTMRSEITEETANDSYKLNNVEDVPKLVKVIDSHLDMAVSKRCIGDVTKNADLFSRPGNSNRTSTITIGSNEDKFAGGKKFTK